MQTLYGEIPDDMLKEFEEVSGNRLDGQDWSLVSDEIEYWKLSAAESQVEERKWKKGVGYLPARDFNFQFACYQCPKIVLSPSGEKIKVFDLLKAIKYAKEKLFINNKPVYLPEFLWEKQDPILFDTKKKPPKSYSKILEEEKLTFENE